MAKEEYKEFHCKDIGMTDAFCVRAKTESEVMEHAKAHAMKAHGMKEVWPETEKKIKSSIKSVSVEVPERK
jgi:predicted small metal-binding protein